MRTKLIIIGLVAVAGAVIAGQRLRVIDVDSASTPVKSAAVSVALTPATTGSVSVATGSKAATTAVALTLETQSITFLSPDLLTTNTLTVVTNVTVNGVYGFASSTAAVLTNATAGGSAYGFTAAQANGILTNANLLYQLLQTY